MSFRRADWDADAYHRISGPQYAWGQGVLARLELRGDERLLDAGCGTGRLTAGLAARLARGRMVALDRSAAMTRAARTVLPQDVAVVQGDLLAIPFQGAFDVLFSTATFHWVLDPDSLYRGLFAVLKPGGRLHAQCGGAGNLARLHARMHALMREPRYADAYQDYREPWLFARPEEAAERLAAAGFVDIACDLESAPTPFVDEAAYREFTDRVVLADYFTRVSEKEREAMLDVLCDAAAADSVPYTLDYVRLNLSARRPALAAS